MEESGSGLPPARREGQLRILLTGLRAGNYSGNDVAIISGKVFRAYPGRCRRPALLPSEPPDFAIL